MLTHCLRFSWLCFLILAWPKLYASERNFNVQLMIAHNLGMQADQVKVKKIEGLSEIVSGQVINSKAACIKKLGRCSIVAKVKSSKGYVVTLVNWYEVHVLMQSPVLNEAVKEGEAYNSSKVVFNKKFIRLGSSPSKKTLIRSEFIQMYEPGVAVTCHMLRERLIVDAGDEVTVKYFNRHISIEAKAIALSSGSLGSEINVVRGSGEQTFRAVVIGPKKLEVKI